MNKTFKYLDKGLLLLAVIGFVFGTFNLVTSSSGEALTLAGDLYSYFKKQAIIIIVATILVTILIKIFPLKIAKKFSIPIYILGIIVLVFMLFYVKEVRGAKNWFPLLGFAVQPSEFMKIIMILTLAYLFEKWQYDFTLENKYKYTKLAYILAVGAIPTILVFLQKDLGGALIIMFIFLIMFWFSPIMKKDKQIVTLTGLILCGVVGITLFISGGKLLSQAQMARFNFINPCSKYEEDGYQICNAYIAFNNGGLFGVGVGKSHQKYSYIPEAHTDMVFAIIVEEYGGLFAFLIFSFYLLLLKNILNISKNASTVCGKYLSLGIASYIFIHIFINLGGLFGVIPLTGVPLPFLSYGGSFSLSLIGALGLVQMAHIEKQKALIKIK